jgi:hypothetical protein
MHVEGSSKAVLNARWQNESINRHMHVEGSSEAVPSVRWQKESHLSQEYTWKEKAR